MRNRYIYLIFSKTGTWLSKTINIFVESKYVHVSISLDNTFNEMYSFGRTNPDNPFSGGLVKEDLRGGVYKKFSDSECLIYKVRIKEQQYQLLKKELKPFLENQKKYRYNLLGLFGVLLNIPCKRENYYFCSQFVSELLIKSKIYNADKIPELVKPADLLQIKNKEFVYEGFINGYDNYSYRFSERFSI